MVNTDNMEGARKAWYAAEYNRWLLSNKIQDLGRQIDREKAKQVKAILAEPLVENKSIPIENSIKIARQRIQLLKLPQGDFQKASLTFLNDVEYTFKRAESWLKYGI